ncbi:MAG: DUF2330 domain-containing protein [Phycisphaerales bacterium]
MARSLAFLLSLLLPLTALADGGVFLHVDTRANLPDQQAMIVYLDGTETLAIETRARAAGDEIAWVVPLPAIPEVSPATTGTIPTLRAACAPRRMDVPGQFAFALGWLLMAALCMFTSKGTERRGAYVACAFLLFFVGCLLLPTLGKARGGSDDGVSIASRSIVGSYEVTTINPEGGDLIASWLNTNGFKTPADAIPVLEQYAKEGWCFVACKLRRDDAGESLLTPHPLVFRFKTDRVVYPMRLTGAANTGDLSLELYVFGNSEARVEGMETRYSQRAVGDHARFTINSPERSHPAIAALAKGTTRLTMLRGTFTRDDMKRDITIDWREPHDFIASVAGQQDATMLGVCIAIPVLIVAAVYTKIAQVRGKAPRVRRILVASLLLAALSGGVAYASVEKAPMVLGRSAPVRRLRLIAEATYIVRSRLSSPDAPRTLNDFRAAIAEALAAEQPDLAQRPIEQDSPGNYTLEELDGQPNLLIYEYGAVERQPLTPLLAPRQ